MFLERTLDERMKKNKMAVGIDLRNDVTQISFCMLNQSIPDTYSTVAGAEEYDLPTLLCRKLQENSDGTTREQWLIGKDALQASQNHEGDLVEDLILLGKNQEKVLVGDTEYQITYLFEQYFKKCLFLVAPGERLEDIISLSFVLKDQDEKLVQNLRIAVEHLQQDATELSFLTYEDCFYHYIIHQTQEMWIHDVVMFDYRQDGVHSYYLTFNRGVTPIVASIQKKDFPQMKIADLSKYEEKAKAAYFTQLDESFLEINHALCDDKIITSVFLIGEQFTTQWCKQAIKYLCSKGRVFQGANMYSKGACYHARERVAPTTLSEEICYISEGKLNVNIGIVYAGNKEELTRTLITVGTNWQDARAEMEIILLRDNKISLVISSINGKKPKVAEITMDGYEVRRNKTSRVGLFLYMTDKNTLVIEIKDLGFGEFFASTGQVWREELRLED